MVKCIQFLEDIFGFGSSEVLQDIQGNTQNTNKYEIPEKLDGSDH